MYGVAAGAAALVIGAGIVMSGAGSAGTAGPEAMATTGPPEIGQATNDPASSTPDAAVPSPSHSTPRTATPSAASGTLARTPAGATFLRPIRWTAISSGAGALHSTVCVRPAGQGGCGEGGIEIVHDFTPGIGESSLDGTYSVASMFGCRGGEAHPLKRESRRNRYHEMVYREYLVQCTEDVQFEAQTWYFPESSTLIKVSRTSRAAADLVVSSFRLPADDVKVPEPSPDSAAREQALAIDEFLDASARTRAKLRTAVERVQRCRNIDDAIAALDEVWAERSGHSAVAIRMGGYLQVDELDGGDALLLNLGEAMSASQEASGEYLTWAKWFRSSNCVATDVSNEHLAAGNAASARAEKAKRFFVKQWNRIAQKEGLVTRKASEI
jgi:hypothetical protein